MKECDFSRFSALMLGLVENFGQSLSPQGIALRFRALVEYSIDEVEQAALSLMLNRKYASMPTVQSFWSMYAAAASRTKPSWKWARCSPPSASTAVMPAWPLTMP